MSVTGFMISAKEEIYSSEVITIIMKQQNYIKRRFEPTVITISRHNIWVSFYVPEYLYTPVLTFVTKIIHKKSNIELIRRPFPIKQVKNEGVKYKQIQAFHKSANEIVKLYNWITTNNYCHETPIIRQCTRHNKYHIKWNVPKHKRVTQIIGEWELHPQQITLSRVHITPWINNQKNNAIIALNQLFKYA